MLFSIAAKQNLVMESIDIKTAFLYSKMNEEVYLKRRKNNFKWEILAFQMGKKKRYFKWEILAFQMGK